MYLMYTTFIGHVDSQGNRSMKVPQRKNMNICTYIAKKSPISPPPPLSRRLWTCSTHAICVIFMPATLLAQAWKYRKIEQEGEPFCDQINILIFCNIFETLFRTTREDLLLKSPPLPPLYKYVTIAIY